MGLLAHPSFVFATSGSPIDSDDDVVRVNLRAIWGMAGIAPFQRAARADDGNSGVGGETEPSRARESYCSWAMCVGTLVSHSPCELQVDPRSNMIHHWCWHVPEGCLWDLGTIFRAEANSQFRISDWIDGKALKGRDCSDVCNVCNVSRIFLIFLVLGRWHLLGWPLAAEFCSAPGPSHSGQ